eukprot:TRINITY_DN5322_c0_g1_i1.p1 TRINITY_DN5322_c0_g1~~TRINITY_DN5322_c0_g1_i1.p1  ORF type:complete len:1048 (-),score=264.07 TRINITY_DN5322_c0_g1_i1:43-3135(-)
MAGRDCYGCKQPIRSQSIQGCNQSWHNECFQCSRCRQVLDASSEFFTTASAPFAPICMNCQNRATSGTLCAACNTPIIDEVVNALGKKWHARHFVCQQCRRSLIGQEHFPRDGQPYCRECFPKVKKEFKPLKCRYCHTENLIPPETAACPACKSRINAIHQSTIPVPAPANNPAPLLHTDVIRSSFNEQNSNYVIPQVGPYSKVLTSSTSTPVTTTTSVNTYYRAPDSDYTPSTHKTTPTYANSTPQYESTPYNAPYQTSYGGGGSSSPNSNLYSSPNTSSPRANHYGGPNTTSNPPSPISNRPPIQHQQSYSTPASPSSNPRGNLNLNVNTSQANLARNPSPLSPRTESKPPQQQARPPASPQQNNHAHSNNNNLNNDRSSALLSPRGEPNKSNLMGNGSSNLVSKNAAPNPGPSNNPSSASAPTSRSSPTSSPNISNLNTSSVAQNSAAPSSPRGAPASPRGIPASPRGAAEMSRRQTAPIKNTNSNPSSTSASPSPLTRNNMHTSSSHSAPSSPNSIYSTPASSVPSSAANSRPHSLTASVVLSPSLSEGLISKAQIQQVGTAESGSPLPLYRQLSAPDNAAFEKDDYAIWTEQKKIALLEWPQNSAHANNTRLVDVTATKWPSELGSDDVTNESITDRHIEREKTYFTKYMFTHPHKHYLVVAPEDSDPGETPRGGRNSNGAANASALSVIDRAPGILTVMSKPEEKGFGISYYKAIMRTIVGDDRFVVLMPTDDVSSKKKRREALLNSHPILRAGARIIPLGEDDVGGKFGDGDEGTSSDVVGNELSVLLSSFEKKQNKPSYKFGVLYCKNGQTTEHEMYENASVSPEFEEFLTFLGNKIELNGHTGYTGGLSAKDESTGKYSIYTLFKKRFEIMFHVSTYIPNRPGDSQQVDRKKHLGNDVILIVFKEGAKNGEEEVPFKPEVIESHFNHVYVVVQPIAGIVPVSYRMAIVYKPGVRPSKPFLPHPSIYAKNEDFREFLLTKLINAEIAAMESPEFLSSLRRTRRELILEIVAKYAPKIAKRYH